MIGKINYVSQDFLNGGIILQLSMKNCSVQELQTLSKFDEIDIDMKKHREHRSRDANAYFHVLCGKIADVMIPPHSKSYIKNMMICRYGQPDIIDGQQIHITTEIPLEKMLEQEFMHCTLSDVMVDRNKVLYTYNLYRGSRTYDTKEMSILIDGTVQDAKELGIETLPPDELKRMVEAWKA